MFETNTYVLKILAAIVWLSGIGILFVKSANLFILANNNGIASFWLAISILSGILIGWIKAKYLFINICNKNLIRIDSLPSPRLWQFYRVPFFIFLGLMIYFGSYAYQLVQGDTALLITLAIIELSVGTALLLSSHCFWKDYQLRV